MVDRNASGRASPAGEGQPSPQNGGFVDGTARVLKTRVFNTPRKARHRCSRDIGVSRISKEIKTGREMLSLGV